MSVLCKSFKERFFYSAFFPKADAKVLLISELTKLLENIFEENTKNWGKSMEMSTKKHVIQHKNRDLCAVTGRYIYLIIYRRAREKDNGVNGFDGVNGKNGEDGETTRWGVQKGELS